MTISKRFVSIWNDRELEPGQSTMGAANALLMLPDGYTFGSSGPAVLFVHRWSGYHFDPTPLQMGEAVAQGGIVFLSAGLRRRGAEGQVSAAPDDDVADIALALTYLSNLGRAPVFLVGEGIGALSVGRFASTSHDPRIGGLAFVAPGHAMGWSLAKGIGQDRYDRFLTSARLAMTRGVGRHHLIDVQRGPRSNTILQQAESWLHWWGPAADSDLSRFVQNIEAPVFLFGADEAWEKTLTDSARASEDFRSNPTKDIARISDLLIEWVASRSAAAFEPGAEMEVLSVQAPDETRLRGFLWEHAEAEPATVLLFSHDAEDIPSATLAVHLAGALARSGVTTLVPELRRTGRAGHLVASLDHDVEDIQAFVEELAVRGYREIVLCGHGFGCIGVTAYQARSGDSRVAGLVLLAPVANGPMWAEHALGTDRYRAVVDRARHAVENGLGHQLLIDETFQDADDALFHRPGRFLQRAASWLACWGPGSTNRLVEIVKSISVPTLLIGRTANSDRNADNLELVQRAAALAPSTSTVYLEGNDRFEGQEEELAKRIATWIAEVVTRSSARP